MSVVRQILDTKGREVATISPKALLADAAHLLAAKRIGAIVVMSPEGALEGILSERDIVRAVSKHGAAALDRSVHETMTTKVVTCSECDSIGEIMERMTAGRFRHLPVMADGRMTGIVSIGDVVKSRLAEMEHEQSALKDYIMNS
jgi:CBS domain-containing protein